MIMQFGQAGFFEFIQKHKSLYIKILTYRRIESFLELDNNELKFVLGGLVDFM